VVGEPGAATQVAPQDNQLVSKRGILSLKPDLRLNSEASTARTNQMSPIIAAT
jgi:hypothetical protein